MGFAGRIVDDGRPFCEGCGAEAVFGSGDGRFIQQDIGSAQFLGFNLKAVFGVVNRGSESRKDL